MDTQIDFQNKPQDNTGIRSVAFIGFGLIGGSIARKLKAVDPGIRLSAYSRTRESLEQAVSDGNLDEILDAIDERIGENDLILLCTPVNYNAGYLEAVRPYLTEKTIVSDVGSTKTAIHRAAIVLGVEENFVGGHPMAGSERTGYSCSRENLLENAYYIITPSAKCGSEKTGQMVAFAQKLSAIPLVLDYGKHDQAVAAISHVPHLVAASLVNLVAENDSDGTMKKIAAGGFKDITRIASSSPEMWQQICDTNKEAIIPLLDRYSEMIREMADALRSDDDGEIFDAFVSSGAYRGSISEKGGATFNPQYAIYCDIPDKPGAISVIVTLLTYEGISIKNIGINHNREHQDGTLKIEFHDKKACDIAAGCLESHSFPVYRKKP